MKKLITVLLLFLCGCKFDSRKFFQTWTSAQDHCEQICYSEAQDFSGVIRYSMGACICDNEEGRKVEEGYLRLLNPNVSEEKIHCMVYGKGCK